MAFSPPNPGAPAPLSLEELERNTLLVTEGRPTPKDLRRIRVSSLRGAAGAAHEETTRLERRIRRLQNRPGSPGKWRSAMRTKVWHEWARYFHAVAFERLEELKGRRIVRRVVHDLLDVLARAASGRLPGSFTRGYLKGAVLRPDPVFLRAIKHLRDTDEVAQAMADRRGSNSRARWLVHTLLRRAGIDVSDRHLSGIIGRPRTAPDPSDALLATMRRHGVRIIEESQPRKLRGV